METQETYRKVFVKSVDDLPKEGKYHFHIIGDSSLRFKDVESASFRQLKRRVNYYLLPIQEQPVEMPTETEIKRIIRDYYSDSFLGISDIVINDMVKGAMILISKITKTKG